MAEKKKPNNPSKFIKPSPWWIYIIVLAGLGALYLFSGQGTTNKDVSWNEFQSIAKNEAFKSIVVDRTTNIAQGIVKDTSVDSLFRGMGNSILPKGASNYSISTQIPSVDRFSDFCDTNHIQTQVEYKESKSNFWAIFWNVFPLIILIGFWFYMMKRMSGAGSSNSGGGGIFSVGKSKANLYDENTVKVTFKDVAGLNEAKEEIEEIVHFLKNPEKYTQLGGKIPKGALLVGPPGTGKTLLAKAVAGEANVPFFSMSGSDFVEMFVGVGASRVRDLFKKAKEKAPCIVFIDEIDAVGRARGRNNNFGGNDERENTLNQLLTEMDGFGTNSGIIMLAATNRADILDSALMRSGRFDRQIHVDLPDINDRKEIFKVHLRDIKTDNSLDLDLLSRQTPGFSGADIANICNEAALIAARREAELVSKQDFMNAVDRIIGGLEKKSRITTEEERKSIAIHEAGHATVSWHLKYANPLVKVTIVPRGKALGAAWYLPEERQITTTAALLDQICALLAGRAAEELFLGRISTGAANDLERVTKMAYAMVTYYGMSDQLPNINYYDMQNNEYSFAKPYSERTAELIDKEVQQIITEQYNKAKSLLTEKKDGHAQLTQILLDREIIYTEDVEHIFGKRPWISRADEISKIKTQEPLSQSVVRDDISKEDDDNVRDKTQDVNVSKGETDNNSITTDTTEA